MDRAETSRGPTEPAGTLLLLDPDEVGDLLRLVVKALDNNSGVLDPEAKLRLPFVAARLAQLQRRP